MKNISSTTENFIREQIEIKFKKKLDALKKKKTALDAKLHGLSEQIDKLEFELGKASCRCKCETNQLRQYRNIKSEKVYVKTFDQRLRQIVLKMVNKEKAIERIIERIINTKNNRDEINEQIQEFDDQKNQIYSECKNIETEIGEINEIVSKHVKDIVIKLELGGNYDDLMKMIDEIQA